ncbi:MAG: hypothetical protein II875_10830 [Clostridia bacterium]|nr:hypothetical protein [Clostridia bacterium]
MTFEERLKQTDLPATAKLLLPDMLSERTKKELMLRNDMETIIRSAIDKIEAGSTERLEDLISVKLSN